MTISVKPKISEIEKIIKKGGSSTTEKEDLLKRKMISMKIDEQILQTIDKHVINIRKTNYNYNRQQWIIEAIQKRLNEAQ